MNTPERDALIEWMQEFASIKQSEAERIFHKVEQALSGNLKSRVIEAVGNCGVIMYDPDSYTLIRYKEALEAINKAFELQE